MHIAIEWFTTGAPQFNVSIASSPDREPFIVIKGCRIVSGKDGDFVSWPATKNERSGKWWNHVYASPSFAAKVLEEAATAQPKQAPAKSRRAADDDSVPF